jgi:hypothetical protein
MQINVGTFSNELVAAVHHDIVKVLLVIEGYIANHQGGLQRLNLNFQLETLRLLASEVCGELTVLSFDCSAIVLFSNFGTASSPNVVPDPVNQFVPSLPIRSEEGWGIHSEREWR